MSSFNFEIIEGIATLSESEDGRYTTELNLISYNGKEAKWDIRKWDRKDNRMFKGVALNDDELIKLKEALEDIEF